MIRLAPDLELPLDVATETIAILAKRGSGKTYTAAVLTEQLVRAGVPTVVIDPVGVWWGLRAGADGKAGGLPVAIFGGDHADVPLDERSGKIVADAIVSERFSAIIDLSLLSKSAMRRFMTDFIARLYHRNREALHLIVDEADAFAPQRGASGDAAPLLGAMEDLVRRGRARGIGCTLITQRPAVLHKDVLTQAEILICLRMTGPRDVAAMDEWVRLHAEDDEAREVKKSLPALAVGTAWVWSPGLLGILQKVKIAKRETFDSSATPTVGQKRIVPKTMADIDLTALGEQIAAAAETAKADDPKELRAEVARLRRQLAERKVEVERVEVPVLTDDDRDLLRKVADLAPTALEAGEALSERLGAVLGDRHVGPTSGEIERRARATRVHDDTATKMGADLSKRTGGPSSPQGGKLPKAQAAIIGVLAQRGAQTAVQVAMLTGYSVKGGGFNNALGALRSAGLVVGSKDRLELTADGHAAAADVPPLPTGEALLDHWRGTFGKAERLIFDVLVDAWPQTRTRDEVADLTGYAPNGGGFNNAVGRLRTLQLISGGKDALVVIDELGEARGS